MGATSFGSSPTTLEADEQTTVDVRLTDEQQLWSTTVERLARELAMTEPDDSAADRDRAQGWQQVLDLGIPALRSAELSGLTETGVETALAAEHFGRHLVPLPLLGQAMFATELLAAAGAAEMLERVAAGDARLAPALDPTLSRFAYPGERAVAWDAAGATHALTALPGDDGVRLVATPVAPKAKAGLDITRRHTMIAESTAAEDIGPLGTAIEPTRWAKDRVSAKLSW